ITLHLQPVRMLQQADSFLYALLRAHRGRMIAHHGRLVTQKIHWCSASAGAKPRAETQAPVASRRGAPARTVGWGSQAGQRGVERQSSSGTEIVAHSGRA